MPAVAPGRSLAAMPLFGRWVLAHKRLVVVSWLLLTVTGAAAVGPAANALKTDPSLPGKEGWATNAVIGERYGADPSGSSPLLPVVTLPRGATGPLARSARRPRAARCSPSQGAADGPHRVVRVDP
jgi:uncharacterized membrane protein YdfJ with MMPL/SSD domain